MTMSMPTTTKPASRAAEAESEKGSEILERLKSRLTKNAKAAEANTLTPLQIDALAELVCLMNSLQGPLIYLESPVNIVGMSAKLTGFRPVPDGMIRLQGLAVTK